MRRKKFEAMGWDVVTIDGHDFGAIHAAIERAKTSDNGRPKFIIAKTEIGRGIPEVAGTAKAHGEGGAKFVDAAKKEPRAAGGHAFLRERRRARRSLPV